MVEAEIKRAPDVSEYDNQDNESPEFQSQRIDLFNLLSKKLGVRFLTSPLGKLMSTRMRKELCEWPHFSSGFKNNLWPKKYGEFLEKELSQSPNRSFKEYVTDFSAIETTLGLSEDQKKHLGYLPRVFSIGLDSIDQLIERDVSNGAKTVIMSSVIATNPTFLLRRIINGLEIKRKNKKADELKFKLIFQHPSKLRHLAVEESSRYASLINYSIKKNQGFRFDYKFIRGNSPYWELRYLRHLRVFALTLAAIHQLKTISDEYFGDGFIRIELVKNVMTFRGNITRGGKTESTIFQIIPAYVQSLNTIAKETKHDSLKKELYKEIQPNGGIEEYSADALRVLFEYCLREEASIINSYEESFRRAFCGIYSEKIPSYQTIINRAVPEKKNFKKELLKTFNEVSEKQDEVDSAILIGTPIPQVNH